jgi:2-dehydropantoate 2-reductase
LNNLLEKDGIALTLQNGLGNLQLLEDAVGEGRAAQGVTTYGATLIGPGMVRPGGEGIVTVQDHPRLSPLTLALRDSGINVQVAEDLSSIVWGKLIINVAINPLTALLEVKNGQLLESQAAATVMGLAASEAASVARNLGIDLIYQDPAQAAESVAKATGENFSSMLQDIRRGAPTEIDALCGEIVRKGSLVGQPTPVNQLLNLLVKAKVDRNKDLEYENSC